MITADGTVSEPDQRAWTSREGGLETGREHRTPALAITWRVRMGVPQMMRSPGALSLRSVPLAGRSSD